MNHSEKNEFVAGFFPAHPFSICTLVQWKISSGNETCNIYTTASKKYKILCD